MSFEIGDRVTWSKFPEFGMGSVVPDGYSPKYPGHIAVRFDDYEYKGPAERGYHLTETENLTLVEEDPTFEVGDRVKNGTLVGTVEKDHLGVCHEGSTPVRYDELFYGSEARAGGYHLTETENLTLVEGGYIPFVEEVKRLRNLPDDVHHPAHYNQGKIEVWDFIYDQGLGYALGNATKYISRSGKKAGNSKVKDLRKAIAFLEREIRYEETGE